MVEQKVLVITSSPAVSDAVSRALSPAGILSLIISDWRKFQIQDKPMYALALLDMDILGTANFPELKTFLSSMKGLPVIVLFAAEKVSNRDTVEILGAGADDMIAHNTPSALLAAKIRAHLRRGAANDKAAGGWLHT
jgi:DNA-binding response OmpR family regulator